MKVVSIKTRLVRAGECSIEDIVTESISDIPENTVVVVSSKIIALCQNRVVDKAGITKPELIKREADYYTPDDFNKYNFNFAILNNTFIPSAGIDESNVDGQYLLWPSDPQGCANDIRAFLRMKYSLENVGVIVTDSTSMPPMRAGTIGIMIAHSGFKAVNELAGELDLFGRPFEVSRSSVGGGLAAAANVVMGEGAEQTPIAVISDIPFVKFCPDNPDAAELRSIYIDPSDDMYAPFIQSAPWQKGGGSHS